MNAETPAGADLDAALAPSGKGAADENFPVGSILIAKKLRPHVARFYHFARAIDDIADDPELQPREKIARLDACEAGLLGQAPGPAPAARLAISLRVTGVSPVHGQNLLKAFRQDAVKDRYASWDELMDYCRYSANPVGAFLLELHGEPENALPASDALCTALQVLNHLQDLKDDLRQIRRCYLPQDWLEAEGARAENVLANQATPGIRRVIDRCLEETQPLIAEAETLSPRLASRRLAAESRVIARLARRLAQKLAAEDPIKGRVKLSRGDFARAGLSGFATLLAPFRRRLA